MLFRDVDPDCPAGVGAHREDEVTPNGSAPRFDFRVSPESPLQFNVTTQPPNPETRVYLVSRGVVLVVIGTMYQR